MTQTAPLETLTGTVDSVKTSSQHEDSLWAVVTVELDGSQLGNMQMITAVGDLSWVRPGERVELKGRRAYHQTFGEQFKVQEAHTQLPYTDEGIRLYLTKGGAKGIGDKMARRIVDLFGPETFDVIAEQPERLTEVEGIGKKRAQELTRTWKAESLERHIKVTLFGWGVSPAYVPRLQRAYGDQAPEIIKHNPYRLAHEVHGFGFKKADAIAKHLGIRGDDPRRVQAGVLYVLAEAQKNGHLYLPLEDLLEKASDYLQVGRGQIEAGVEALHHRKELIHEPVPADDQQDGHLAVYSARAWEAEVECAQELRRLADEGQPVLAARTAALIEQVQGDLGLTLAPAQSDAIRMAFMHRLLVITGGPGTGKTTLVKAVCRVAELEGLNIALAAPTGRAARRLGEATGQEARTLHRLLEFSFQAGGFQRDADNPLDADLLVVDEASMIDVHLMRALVRAVPSRCRLVLVGDVDQLPSVGPGDVLADLIRSQAVPVCRLQMVFRQSEASAIVRNAHRVNQGQFPEQIKPLPGQLLDFYTLIAKDPEDIFAKVLKVVTERIPDAFEMDPIRDLQVIAPMHSGVAGCKNLNESLQEALNPSFGAEIKLGQRVFRPGDRVMQLRNNYDKEIFNGDVGYVTGLNKNHDGVATGMRVSFEDREVEFQRDELDELTLAYAVTAHKSQGSEYRAVVLPLATAHYVMLERNLLYTAITRARELVVLVAMKQALSRAVRNVSASSRHTRLAARLSRAIGG